MILRFTLLVCLSLPMLLNAQSTDYLQHIQTIRRAHPSDSTFLEFVIQEVLESPQDVIFITNRQLLDGLCVSYCGSKSVKVKDTLRGGSLVELELKTAPFHPMGHTLEYGPGPDSILEAIDELPAFGAVSGLPARQIDTLWIRINGKPLYIPPSAYANLYDPDLCYNELFHRAVMLYRSANSDYLYLYIYGGEGNNTYLAKLVFDGERFLKKIVTEYADLVSYDAYRWEFIGY